jgi:hypothetical protein
MQSNLSKISIFMGKNKRQKVVYVKEATFYLKKLQQQSKSDFVFSSQKNIHAPITDVTAHRYIKEIGKHINKKIFPYLVRHSRSQELYELVDQGKLSENVAMKTLGHKRSMRDIYHELKDSTIREAIENSVYKFQELPPEEKDALIKQMEEMRADRVKDRKELKALQEFVMRNLKPVKGKVYKDVQE